MTSNTRDRGTPKSWWAIVFTIGLFFSLQPAAHATNNSLSFNGGSADQLVTIPSNAAYDIVGTSTLEFWLKRNSAGAPAGYENIIGKDNYPKSNGWAVVLQYNTGKLRFETYGVSGGLTSNFAVFDTNWHHFALTRSAGGFTQIYIDGVLDTSANIAAPATNTYALNIGNANNRSNAFFGTVDEVRFWNFERIAGDINCFRRLTLSGNESGLVSYFNFDAGAGQAVTDGGPLHNNGQRGIDTGASGDPAWTASNIPNFGSACDSTPPTGKITSPSNAASPTISALAAINGTSADNTAVNQVRVQIRRNSDNFYWNEFGKYWGSTFSEYPLASGLANWTFPGNDVFWSPNTSYTLMATIVDMDGNQFSDTSNITATADVDATAPTISMYNPTNGGSYTGSQLPLFSGGASDNNALSQVTVAIKRISDNLYWNANSASWVAGPINNYANGLGFWQLTVPVSAWSQPGSYTIAATAVDTSNNSATTSPLNFTITGSGGDVNPPTVSIYAIAYGQDYPPSQLTMFSGNAADDVSVNQVSVVIKRLSDSLFWNPNSVSWVAAPINIYPSGTGYWQFTMPISAWSQTGYYSIIATAFDSSNNSATTGQINFSIGGGGGGDSTNPTVSIYTPPDASNPTISSLVTFSGGSNDNVNVQNVRLMLHGPLGYWNTQGKYWSNTPVSNAVTGLTFWTFPGNEVAWNTGSSYTLSLTATDSSGNQATATSNFTTVADAEATPPTLSIYAPTNNGVYSADQLTLFSGNASDNVGVGSIRVRVTRLSDNKDWDPGTVSWLPGPLSNNASGLAYWQYTMPVSAFSQAGSYSMAVTATDLSNNQTYQTVNFSVSSGGGADYVFPTVNISHPGNNTTQSPSALVTMSGSATDDRGYVQVSASVKNIGNNHYWDGAGFNSIPEIFNVMPNANPWSFTSIPSNIWANGSYRLRVKAVDGNNNESSITSDFTVNTAQSGDTNPPYVTVWSPVNGSVYDPVSLYINGSAGDNMGLQTVEVSVRQLSTNLYYNGAGFQSGVQTFQTANGLAYWSFSLPSSALANDSYTLEVRAKDTSNNIQSQIITFTISGAVAVSDTISPTGNIYTPSNNGAYTSAASLATLSGMTNDNNQVSEALIWMRDSSNNYFNGNSWSSPTPVTQSVGTASLWQLAVPINAWKNDSFTVFLQVRDAANNLTTVSNQFTVSGVSGSGTADTVPPQIYTTNPYDNASQTPNSFVTLSGRADDAFGIANLTLALKNVTTALYYNGATFSAATQYPLYPVLTHTGSGIDFTYTVLSSIYTNGSYALEITAADSSGNTNTRTVNFTVYGAGQGAGDATPPTVSVYTPANNNTYTSSQLTLLSGGSSDDMGVDYVETRITRVNDGFEWDGGSWRQGDFWIRDSGTALWSLTLPISMWSDGNYIVTARARDLSGKETQASNTITVSGAGVSAGTPPTVAIYNLQNAQVYQPANVVMISGTAADDLGVSQVQVDIMDMNLFQHWDSGMRTWVPGNRFTNVSQSNGYWSMSNLPYWNNGHYQVTAQALDTSNLLSIPAVVDFYIAGTNAGTVNMNNTDFTPPAAIQNLAAVSGQTPGSVTLSWTSTGDDGNTGTATAVMVKYGPNPITTEGDWTMAFDVTAPPVNTGPIVPAVAGTARTLTLNGLTPGVNYFFSIRARDEAFNTSWFSNSVSAVAFGGCQATAGDGEGTAVASPATLPTSTDTNLTLTFNVGAHGILSGGKVLVRIPDGWAYPQTYSPAMSGYVTATTSNGLVTMTPLVNGQMIELTANGTLNQHDTVTVALAARTYSCDLQANLPIKILSQATACGVPTEIAAQPTVSLTAGNANWLAFENYETFAQVGQVTAIKLLGKSNCGQLATVAANTTVNFTADSNALVANNINMTGGAASGSVLFPSGQNTLTLYYQLQNTDGQNRSLKASYLDFNTHSYNSENYLTIYPLAGGSVISNASVDTGVRGSLTNVTMTPNGDGQADEIYINYELAAQNVSSQIEISKDNFATILTTLWGYGKTVRMSWNGTLTYPLMGSASSGNYQVRIRAAGATDTTLSFAIQSTGLQGTVRNKSNSAPIENASVNIYGVTTRTTQTLADGTFEIGSLTPGQYTLHVEKQGYESRDLTVTFDGNNQNLGGIPIAPLARIVVNASRANATMDLWGSIRTKETQAVSSNLATANEKWDTIHFAYGRIAADNATINLKAGVEYILRLDLPGFTTTPLTYTLGDGETYTWNLNLTPKKGLSGFINLANGISNVMGYPVNISAGLKDPNKNAFASGYAEKFSQAYIPVGESRVAYTLPDLGAGTYLVTFDTPGLSPETVTIVVSASDVTQDVTLTKGGAATLNLTFTGNTTTLDSNDGFPSDSQFRVSMRYSNAGSSGFQMLTVPTGASGSNATATVNGLSANGTYDMYFDPLPGFSPVVPGPYKLTMAGGTGNLSVAFAQDSGTLVGTVSLPNGSSLNTASIYLYKDMDYRSNPTITGNQFTFSNLGNGRYNLSLYDPATATSRSKDVFITNGKTTNVSLDLNAVAYYSLSGTVRTVAAPPYDSLASIAANSTNSIFHTATGDQSVSSLRVQAQLMNADGTVDPLPTTSGQFLNPTKFKYGTVNSVTGAYAIPGLEAKSTYLVSVNDDLNADGKPDLPRTSVILSPTADTIQDFTIQKGGDIQVTLTTPVSESAYQLTVKLTDAVLKKVVQEKTVSVVGASASATFSNLQTGSYVLSVTDGNTPVKYTAKPVVVSLANASDTKSATLALSNSGRVQLTLANKFGTLVTAANKDQVLPKNTTVRLATKGQTIIAALDSSDGKFKADILPGNDYEVSIQGDSFLPVLLHASIAQGGDVLDLGVVTLKQGKSVTGTLVDESGNGIGHIPVLAYQSLSKSIAPLQIYTNDIGVFTFDNLSEVVRYFDFVANPLSNADSNPTFTEGRKLSMDIKSDTQISNMSIVLKTIKGSLKGQLVSSANRPLVAGYGANSGRPGVSILVMPRNQKTIYEFLSNADGSFAINVPAGLFDFEFITQNHQPKRLSSVTITDQVTDTGILSLIAGGANLSGTIRTTDNGLPSTYNIDALLAVDNQKNTVRASLVKILLDDTEYVDSYAFSGLQPATLYKILALDKSGRAKVLKDGYEMPAIDTTLALVYNVTEPKLTANFILKVPERNAIEGRFACNQKFRNKSDADNDLSQFVTITKGNGTLAGDSFSADRYSANYTYTLGDETGNDHIAFRASFNTEENDPKTGNSYNVTGDFNQPLGILAQQTNDVNCLVGSELSLPDGTGITIPAGACANESMVMKLQSADDLTGVSNQVSLSSLSSRQRRRGLGAMATADKLGASAYPAEMYQAIKALEQTPTVNPFSSFYDIFLPAGVSHLFDRNNKPTLTLKYDETADPTTLNVYYFNPAQGVYTIENTNRRVDTANHTITVEVGHASIFTVLSASASIIQGGGYTGELDVFNFPNPFDLNTKAVTLQNPGSVSASQNIQGTMIKISVPAALPSSAKIEIFNMAGELVRTINADGLTSGSYNYVEWDGANDHGAKVASGVYIGQVTIGSQKKFFKMAVVK